MSPDDCPGARHGTATAYQQYGCRCDDARLWRTRRSAELMADSATPPALADTPTPNTLFVARMARVDGCPACVANYALPRAVLDLSDPEMGGFVAAYHCEDCGHYWITSWGDN